MNKKADSEEFSVLMKKIGLRIKTLRKEKKMRQEDFERGDYSISLATLQRIEYGEANPSLLQLYKISKQLKVELHELLKFHSTELIGNENKGSGN
jgi:transcriptional regulator with XRE-family HTH domain